jgi:hypothetical protein|tara:strand:- start:1348 stop:1773 length:426 start_codon:yes stop_codon:yes gene_type:complete
MVIEPLTLLAYAIIWTIFYFFLSEHIAQRSRKTWTAWIQSEESDEVLVEALVAVIDEIEQRMHEKLEDFQSSFFGSVGSMVKKGQDLDPMNNLRKAAKNQDWTSLMLEYVANKSGLGDLNRVIQPKEAPKEAILSPKLDLK